MPSKITSIGEKKMFTQGSILRRYYKPFAGFMLACNFAVAQNWVPSGPPGAPVIPFDALADGYVASTSPKTPLYSCRGGEREGYGLQVGKFTPGSTGCEFGYGGLEISVPDFEFLVTSWQAESGGVVPANAVAGGADSPDSTGFRPPLYICRGKVGGGPLGRPPITPSSLQLGKIRPGFGGCFVPYSGKEISLFNYEVLVAENPAMPLAVIPEINGFVPQDAIRAGTDVDGTPLYICSAIYAGGSHPGKLHSSFGGCNISYAGVEHTISSYLVFRPNWLGIPKFDFRAGTDTDGSPLHVCRAFFSGSLYPGKTRETWKTCNFGLAGKEEAATVYEILSN
jgi:hypothetical protein